MAKTGRYRCFFVKINLISGFFNLLKNLFKGKRLFFFLVILSLIFALSKLPFRDKSAAAFLLGVLNKDKQNIEDNQGADFLGGPTVNDESLLSNNLAVIDLTIDDQAENADFTMLQENSIIGYTNPSLINQFSAFRKDVINYTVSQGDNPEKIAMSFGINTDTLLWANNLRSNSTIRPGDQLTIMPINGVRHKIISGDSFTAVAKKYNAKIDEIKQFNDLTADADLKVGSYIIVPDGEMPLAPKPQLVKAPKFALATPSLGSWLIMPTTGFNWGRLHSFNGVDIANQCGTPIYAAAAGKVMVSDMIGWNGGYGRNVRVLHSNSVTTLYAHLSQSLVGVGQEVAQGQLIALMGTTGRSTGCHIHFEVRGAKNPFAWK